MSRQPENVNGARQGWKRFLMPALMLLAIIGVSAVLFIFRDIVRDFEEFGYLGAFLISLVGNATVIFPMPGLLLVVALGAVLNPWLVALAGGVGGALGELSGYAVGLSGRGFARNNKWVLRAEGWMKRWGMTTIFAFALLPFLPFDVAGLIAGASRYPLWKFLIAATLGKTLLYLLMVFAASWGWDFLIGWFD